MPVLYYVGVSSAVLVWMCYSVHDSGYQRASTMYMVSQYYIGNKIRKQIMLIPAMML